MPSLQNSDLHVEVVKPASDDDDTETDEDSDKEEAGEDDAQADGGDKEDNTNEAGVGIAAHVTQEGEKHLI